MFTTAKGPKEITEAENKLIEIIRYSPYTPEEICKLIANGINERFKLTQPYSDESAKLYIWYDEFSKVFGC